MMIGDVLVIMISYMFFVGWFFYIFDFKIVFLLDWEEKLEWFVRIVVDMFNVVMIGGVFIWMVVLLCCILEFIGKDNLLEVWLDV